MKLKSLFIPITAAILFVALGCDKIEQKDRLKPFEGAEVLASGRVVLVEDYTGQDCTNCPIFGAKLGLLAKKHPGRIVSVAVHCGILAYKDSDFSTSAGIAYAQWLGLNAVPAGIVDRKVVNGKTEVFYNFDQMLPSIEAALTEPMQMSLFAKAAFNADSTRIGVEVLGASTEAMAGSVKDMMVQVWLLENNVIDKQHLPNGSTKEDFVHQHLLRAALNGEWGEAFVPSKTYKVEASVPANVRDKKNLHLVVFVYDKANRTVIETIETEIK